MYLTTQRFITDAILFLIAALSQPCSVVILNPAFSLNTVISMSRVFLSTFLFVLEGSGGICCTSILYFIEGSTKL